MSGLNCARQLINCPICDAPAASLAYRSDGDEQVLGCPQCGEVRFTAAAFIQIANLNPAEKVRLADYVGGKYKRNEVINCERLKEIR